VLSTLGVPLIEISTERSLDKIFANVTYSLKPYLQQRAQLFEKLQFIKKAKPLADPTEPAEEPQPSRLPLYERSYTFRQSSFGARNPFSLVAHQHSKDYFGLYRDRIYYFEN